MFTGIVSGRGRVVEVRPGHLGVAAAVASQLSVGGSIAVNGVCLTVTGLEGDVFFAEMVPETLRRTNLGLLQPGDEVNLEPPLRLDQGLDGHVVQGHVDGVGTLIARKEVELGEEVRIELPADLAPLVAEKGSIAVDGVSLTVAAVDDASFTVALIPHTLGVTTASSYRPGRVVNLEVDVLARYARRLMSVQGAR
jgi:riboflavin synthase alpha subunit